MADLSLHAAFPRNILIGKNILSEVPRLVSHYWSGKKITIVTGEHTEKYARSLLSHLDSHTEIYVLPQGKSANEIPDNCRSMLNTQILAVGGGRIIDAGKLITAYTGADWASIPTTTSNDGVITGFVSSKLKYELKLIGREDLLDKLAVPTFCVADLETIAQAPDGINWSGEGDILSNLTAVLDWELATKNSARVELPYNDFAAGESLMAVWNLIRTYDFGRKIPEKEERLKTILNSMICSGQAMNYVRSSRPCSGGDHDFDALLSQHLSSENKSYHGQRCAIGALLSLYLHNKYAYSWVDSILAGWREINGGLQSKLGRTSKRSLDNKIHWRPFKKMMQACGLPTTAESIGLSQEDILKIIDHLPFVRTERSTIFTHIYNLNSQIYKERIKQALLDLEII